MIRPFTYDDLPRCTEIINEVWEFDEKFHPRALSDLFKGVYTGGSLAASNFGVVAVDADGRVQGFLFGRCGQGPLFKSEYGGVGGSFRFLWRLLGVKRVRIKRKWHYVKIIGEHERNRRRVEPERKDEVNLFAVAPDNQGKGYGKQMMNAFIARCRELGIKRIALDTDRECNYAFYQHMGFKVKGEFYSPLQQEYSGTNGDSYVFELML